jgi:hypothetical protein
VATSDVHHSKFGGQCLLWVRLQIARRRPCERNIGRALHYIPGPTQTEIEAAKARVAEAEARGEYADSKDVAIVLDAEADDVPSEEMVVRCLCSPQWVPSAVPTPLVGGAWWWKLQL